MSIAVNDNALAIGETATVTVTFSEAVSGFTSSDLKVSRGSLSNFSEVTAGTEYTVTLRPPTSGTGTINLNVQANAATDTIGNGNTAATQVTVDYDNTRPTVTIAVDDNTLAIGDTTTVTVTFSEAVSGFAQGELTASTGSLTNFSEVTTGRVYTYTLAPPSPGTGTINLNVAANAATDTISNGNSAATQVSVNYDTQAPTVAITVNDDKLAIGETATVTVTFSEAVSGFVANELTKSAGTLTNFRANSARTTYTATLTPPSTGDGTINVNVGANVATDGVGNGNTAASQITVTYDNTKPTATITVSDDKLAIGETSTVTVTFSEPVDGFVADELTASDGELTNFSGDAAKTVYTATLTPPSTGDGTIDLNVGTNVADDANSNGNTAASEVSVTYDNTKPTVRIDPNKTRLAIGGTTAIVLWLSEPVTGFEESDLDISAGSVANFRKANSTTYGAQLSPPGNGEGTITLDVAADAFTDEVGNGNVVATQVSVAYDTVAPTAMITVADDELAIGDTTKVTVTFSEPVDGFTAEDLTASAGELTNFGGNEAKTEFTAFLNPPSMGDGTVDLNVGAGVATDGFDNDNTAATQVSVVYDNTRPTVEITVDDDKLAIGEKAVVTVTFSETVDGFEPADLTASTGGNLVPFSFNTDMTVFTYSLTPTTSGDGTIYLNVGSNVAGDGVGNGNTAASEVSVRYDNTRPTVTITVADNNLVVGETTTVNVTFSEPVDGFTAGELTSSSQFATLTNFTGSQGSYTATLEPPFVSSGTINLNVAANVATDGFDNDNTAATQVSVTYDTNIPQVQGVTVTAAANTLVVEWSPPERGTVSYRVWWKAGGQQYDVSRTADNINSTSHPISGLTPGTYYTVKVQARDAIGNVGPDSAEVTKRPLSETASVTVTPTALTVGEGATMTYSIFLNKQPSADVVIGTYFRSRRAGVSPSRLTFTTTNWNTPQQITVRATEDFIAWDSAEKLSIRHWRRSADKDYAKVAVKPVILTVNDNDTAGVEVDLDPITPGIQHTRTVDEYGEFEYTIRLTSEPTYSMHVEVFTSAGATARPPSDLPGSQSNLIGFNSKNWNVHQRVTVRPHASPLIDEDRQVTITHVIPSDSSYSRNARYAGVTVPPMTLTIRDTTRDDVGFFTVTEALDDDGILRIRPGSSRVYSVFPKVVPTQDVTITLESTVTNVAAIDTDPDTPGNQNTITFRPEDYNPGGGITTLGGYTVPRTERIFFPFKIHSRNGPIRRPCLNRDHRCLQH